MRKLILLIALLPSTATAAEKPKKPPQVNVNPCAQYGPGFVPIQGTTTCVKLNGYVRTDINRSGPAR